MAPYLRAPDGTWTLQRTGGAATGGTIDLQDLNPGRYRFCVSDVPREFIPECWKDAASVASATDLNIRSGTSPTIVFTLAGRASISGTVTSPAGVEAGGSMQLYEFGEPWPGAEPRWQFVAHGSINPADGTYRITGLDPGTYRACAYSYDTVSACWRTGSQPSDGDDIVLAAGQARTGIDLAPQRAGYVAGVLPDMYLGAQGVPVVSAWRETDDGWVVLSTAEAGPTGPGSQWSYELGSLSAGPVVICVEHQDPEFVPAFPHTCVGDSPSARGGEPIDVTTGQTTTAPPLPTGQAGEIRGRVVDPPRPIHVQLFTRSGRVAATVLTSANGSYRFPALPAGDYRVGFHRNTVRSPLAAEYWRDRQDGSGLAAATPIRVGGSVVSGISVTLNQGGTLTGRLVDADGQPVAQCSVYARGRENPLASRCGGHRRRRGVRHRWLEHGGLHRVGLPPLQRHGPVDVLRRPVADADLDAVLHGCRHDRGDTRSEHRSARGPGHGNAGDHADPTSVAHRAAQGRNGSDRHARHVEPRGRQRVGIAGTPTGRRSTASSGVGWS